MNLEQLQQRLDRMEERLARIEVRLGAGEPPAPDAPARSQPVATRATGGVTPPGRPGDHPALVTSILGWGGAIALVLAAAYLIRLAIDVGWLTPMRQVALAAIGGFLLIGAGFALRESSREYAGLLPAGGIAILFLSIYGAHVFYAFIGTAPAVAAVVFVCALSLWLCRAFASDLYALFAVAGSYSAPFLLIGLRGSMTDLVVYFSAWSVVFSVFAIWHARRLIYLLALYLALIGFDLLWRTRAPGEWIPALVFQTVQFVIFAVATAAFSIRHRAPLTSAVALWHLPAILLFYFLQYALLSRHLPAWAPWLAVASAVAVGALYAITRRVLRRPLPGGELLLWAYVALVLFHAGYIESVPKAWAPWVAFVMVPVVAVATLRRGGWKQGAWPIWVAVAILFLANYLRIIFNQDLEGVTAGWLLAIAYALLLYGGYYFSRTRPALGSVEALLLYPGHVCTMAAAVHLIEEPIVESMAWGGVALACLGLSLWWRDRTLRKSSLLLFAATAVKVLLYDLRDAPPVARVVGLAVLGLTFYVGGLLYQRTLGSAEESVAENVRPG